MIKIILVDDHHLMRESLTALMDKYESVEVVADVANGRELLNLIDAGIQADIVLSDVLMPEMDGIEMIPLIRKKSKNIKIVLLSVLEDEKYASNAFIAGANAYLLKSVGADELMFCLQHVMKGHKYISSSLCISILERFNKQLVMLSPEQNKRLQFSERELSVLKLIGEGMTNQEMADRLFLSRRTVEGLRQALIDRTGCKNTAALVRFSILNGYAV